ncbi:unnamed protein product [Rhizopus stolonifer]
MQQKNVNQQIFEAHTFLKSLNMETSNVFIIENQTECMCVCKRIKQAAVDIHNEYVKGIDIGAESKLVMDLDLSSILDLTHEENNYQAYIHYYY